MLAAIILFGIGLLLLLLLTVIFFNEPKLVVPPGHSGEPSAIGEWRTDTRRTQSE